MNNLPKHLKKVFFHRILKTLLISLIFVVISSQSIAIEQKPPQISLKLFLKQQKEQDKQILCLAENIYFEARNTDFEEMTRIASVTMNRLNLSKYPKTVCQIVYKSHQFSWTINTKNNIRRIGKLIKKNTFEHSAWIQAKNIAFLTLNGYIKDETHGAVFYHAVYVNKPNSWGNVKLILKSAYHKYYSL